MLFGLSAVLGQFVTAPAVIVAGGRVICSSLLLFLLSIAGRASLKLKSRKDYGIAALAGIIRWDSIGYIRTTVLSGILIAMTNILFFFCNTILAFLAAQLSLGIVSAFEYCILR